MICAKSARFDICTWEVSPCVQLIEVKSSEVEFVSTDGLFPRHQIARAVILARGQPALLDFRVRAGHLSIMLIERFHNIRTRMCLIAGI